MGHIANIGLIVLIIVWVVYRRLRRSIGFQLYAPRKLWSRVIVFSLVCIILLLETFRHPLNYVFDVIGVLIGIVLAVHSIRTSLFETRERGYYYKPNTWVGLMIFALFIGRLAYRFIQIFQGKTVAVGQSNQMEYYYRDPYTGMLFFILAMFYIVYYLILIKRHRRTIGSQTLAGSPD